MRRRQAGVCESETVSVYCAKAESKAKSAHLKNLCCTPASHGHVSSHLHLIAHQVPISLSSSSSSRVAPVHFLSALTADLSLIIHSLQSTLPLLSL